MSGVPKPWRSLPAEGGRLVALLVLAAVLLAGVTGNSLSVHVGMSMGASSSDVVQVDHGHGPVAGQASAVAEAGEGRLAASRPMVPTNSDAQHLMHLVGACLALLVAAALLLGPLNPSRILDPGHAAVAAPPALLDPLTTAFWRPPALDPPTSSPVIRT